MEYSFVHKKALSPAIKAVAALSVVAMLILGIAANTLALTHVVYPTDTMGWVDGSSNGGTIHYGANAPESFGHASLHFTTNATNESIAVYGQEVSEALSDVTTLSYYTSQVQASSAGGSASMFVSLDLNNDTIVDTNLVYEPYLQNAGDPDAQPVVATEWQQWEAGDGLYWSSRGYVGDGTTLELVAGVDGSPLYSLTDIRAAYPNAQVMSFGVSVGVNAPSYTILVDGITINETVYDFEGSSQPKPEFIVPTDKDQCKKMGWTAYANVDGVAFTNQGQCIAYIVSSANSAHHQ